MEMKTENRKQKIENRKPDIRFLYDMKEVLYDQKWAKKSPNFELYYMYRGVKPRRRAFGSLRGKEKRGLPAQILKNKTWEGLRYDITVIPPRMLGEEFVKTKGHEHLGNFGELYTVLKGKVIYLIQKFKKNQIIDVYAVKAKKGESVIVPPGYGHITINPASQELKEANWCSEKCKNIYDLYEKKQGACYYYTKSGWIKNKNYKKISKLRFEKPLKKMPRNLDFLKGK